MNGSPPFAAVLLAGGRSRRMGRDKALLPLADGQVLWQRQLAVLASLRPAELFISGPEREGLPASVTRLEDATPGLGPLGGIAAALSAMRSTRLVVLAVDLPWMTAGFLGRLLGDDPDASAPRGRVPQMDDGFFEPLAAVYPRDALVMANEQLRTADRSLQSFVRRLVEARLVAAYPITDDERPLFANWNRPEDVSGENLVKQGG